LIGLLKIDGLVKSRHSDENRSPETLQPIEKNWIPAFAGMTKNGAFRLFTSSSKLKEFLKTFNLAVA